MLRALKFAHHTLLLILRELVPVRAVNVLIAWDRRDGLILSPFRPIVEDVVDLEVLPIVVLIDPWRVGRCLD